MTDASFSWIWTSSAYLDDEPHLCCFRRTLHLCGQPDRAPCYLTADSRYLFFVNGTRICRGPRKGDASVWFYDETDISPWLKKGTNVLAAIVLRYPEAFEKGNRSVFRMHKPGFAAHGTFIFENDACGAQPCKPQISEWETDSSWQTRIYDAVQIHAGYAKTSRLYIQEHAKGDAAMHGWLTADYDDSFWAPAMSYAGGIGSPAVSPSFLRPRPIPFLYETDSRFSGVMRIIKGRVTRQAWENLLLKNEPLEIPAHSQEIVEIQAARLVCGYPELAVCKGACSRIEILQAESYAKACDHPQDFYKTDRLDFENGDLNGPSDIYKVCGYGSKDSPETYEPFWLRTFRFIRLTVTAGKEPVTLCRFSFRETGYPLEVKTRVLVSDPAMSDIWRISENSLRACMHETYIDCPFYEQLQYAMDSRLEMLFTYAVSADDRLARQTIDDFARSQRADGLINACWPTCKPNVIPQFSIYYICMLHDHMMYFGDRDLIRRYLPYAERILNFFTDLLSEEHMVRQIPGTRMPGGCYWGFTDWAEGWPVGVPPASQNGPLAMDSLLFILGLLKTADLARFLGRNDQAEEYLLLATKIKQGIQKSCAGADGMLTDGPDSGTYSQHVQVFAALTETLTGGAARRALEQTLKRKDIPSCSVAMGFYLFRALEKTGLYEYSNTLWDKWRIMVNSHLTTCQENDGNYVRSDCHAWGAAALYELPCTVLGIRPAAPGYAKVRFSPVPGPFTYAQGEVITPKGLVKASWRLENGELIKQIELPKGLELQYYSGELKNPDK